MRYQKIIFRADGNTKTGLGHLYRLFALVEMYKEQYDIIFLTKSDSVLSVIPEQYNVITIPEGVNIDDEPVWISEKFPSKDYMIILDGYHFISTYQKKLKELEYFFIYIDDLAIEYMYADIVVNHSPQFSSKDFKAAKYTKFALGTKYALLRPLFLTQAKKERKVKDIKQAFVCFGGADPSNLTYKIVRVLKQIQEIKRIQIVLGGAYNHKELFELKERNNEKIVICQNLNEKELIDVMVKSDMAIVPSSTILFELFCIKMPIYSGFFAENQREAFKWFKKLNLVVGKGDFLKTSEDELKKEIKNLITSKDEHHQLIKNQKMMIDGLQKKRYLELINSNCNE